MNTKRWAFRDTYHPFPPTPPKVRLVVVDWVAAARVISELDGRNATESYVAGDSRSGAWGCAVTWAPTGTEEVLGWMRTAAEAEEWLADIELAIEMAEGCRA